MRPTKGIAIGAAATAVAMTAASAIAGTGIGGVFNLGQANVVDALTTLSGNPGSNRSFGL